MAKQIRIRPWPSVSTPSLPLSVHPCASICKVKKAGAAVCHISFAYTVFADMVNVTLQSLQWEGAVGGCPPDQKRLCV